MDYKFNGNFGFLVMARKSYTFIFSGQVKVACFLAVFNIHEISKLRLLKVLAKYLPPPPKRFSRKYEGKRRKILKDL